MIKNILIIVLSVTFFGILLFILVRNYMRKRIDDLVKEQNEKKENSNNFN